MIVSQLINSFSNCSLQVIDANSFFPPPLITANNSFAADQLSFSHCFLLVIDSYSFYPPPLLTTNNSFTVGQISFSRCFLLVIGSTLLVSIPYHFLQPIIVSHLVDCLSPSTLLISLLVNSLCNSLLYSPTSPS